MKSDPPPLGAYLLAALVVFQVGVPLAYYLGEPSEDERFRWRMYSAMRLRGCSAQVLEGQAGQSPRAVELARAYHSSWRNSLGRGRGAVIERILEERCEALPGGFVRVVRRCREPDGQIVGPLVRERRCSAVPTHTGTGP